MLKNYQRKSVLNEKEYQKINKRKVNINENLREKKEVDITYLTRVTTLFNEWEIEEAPE